MYKRKKYIYDNLRKIGIENNIINDLYLAKITKKEIDIICESNYPSDICRLLLNKDFRELKLNKEQIISFINESEKSYQAYYASLAAINKDTLNSNKLISIVYNITRAKKLEYAKLAYEVGIDKDILNTRYPNIATAMASNGTTLDKIYDLVYSDKKDNKQNKIVKIKDYKK